VRSREPLVRATAGDDGRLPGATPTRSPIMAGVKQGRCVVACLGGGVVVEGVVGGDWSRAEDGPLEGGFAT